MSTVVKPLDVNKSGEPEKPAGGFLRHAAVYGIGAIAIQMVSIFLLPLYTRYLSTEEYGVLQILYRVGDVLNICLMVGGIRLAAMNFWGKASSEEERIHVAATIAWLTGVVLVLSLGVVACSAGFFAERIGLYETYPNAGLLLAFGIFAMMLQAITVMPLALMQARLESSAYLVASIGIALCQLLGVTIALVVLDAGVWGVIIAMALTYAAFGTWLTIREFSKSTPIPDVALMWNVVKFSLPFVPSGLCFFILNSGDQFFLIEYCGTATLGIYALAYRIANGVTTFASGPLVQVWHARMYEVYRQEDRADVFGKVYSRILFAFLLGAVGLVLFQDEAMWLLSSPKFAASRRLIAPLMLAHFFLIFANLMDGAFYVERRTGLKPWIALASTVVMVAAYWYLIQRYAEVGAAWATVIGFVFHWALTSVVAQRVFPVKLQLMRLSVVLAASVVLVLGCRQFEAHSIIKAALLLALLGGFWTFGVVHADEKQMIQNVAERTTQRLFQFATQR